MSLLSGTEPVLRRERLRHWMQGNEPPDYWLARFVFLRGVGFLYLVAFFSLANQLLPLLGSQGLLPVELHLDRIEPPGGSLAGFWSLPSLFWLSASDGFLLGTCWLGMALSLVVLLGYANALLLAALWFLYLSFVQVGQTWFRFGWEIQLLETGFLAIFLCPLLEGRPFPRTPPPRAVFWLLRWLVFRVMLGSGLIKLRGDACWQDLTCLVTYYETQPVPHFLSWYLHSMPTWFHRLGVAFNHFVELFVSWFAFGPRRVRHLAGGVLVLFQWTLIASGNLSFLNWLTILPALACFDDTLWRRVLPRRLVDASERARGQSRPSRSHNRTISALVVVVALLSVAPLRNLFAREQVMNTSFGRLHLVNSYGAFGRVGRTRNEVVLQGTRDEVLTEDTDWREYEWKCKPSDPRRRPCWITPYHYRLDWLIWFAAMSRYERHPWIVHLGWKLLHNDAGALSLLASNPFPEAPPRFLRAELYRYEFTDPEDETDAWWKRRHLGSYMPALSAESKELQRFLREFHWIE